MSTFVTCQIILKASLKNKLPNSFDFIHLRQKISDEPKNTRYESGIILRRPFYTAKLTRKLFLKIFIKKTALLHWEKAWINGIIQHISFLIKKFANFTPTFTNLTVENLHAILPVATSFPKIVKLFFTDITATSFRKLSENLDLFVTVTGEKNQFRIYMRNSKTSLKLDSKNGTLCSNSFDNAKLICDKISDLSKLL